MRLFIYGFGYSARFIAPRVQSRHGRVVGTSRNAATREAMLRQGVTAIDPTAHAALESELRRADHLLIAAPPDRDGCPAIAALSSLIAGRDRPLTWAGYLSTTGVYGDHGGRWVFEETQTTPKSPEGERRVAAESQWAGVADQQGFPLAVLRLPGIYGPGRSPFERLREGSAERWDKPGQVFSRIHVEDLATGVIAAMDRPRCGAIYHLCDDLPAAAEQVTAFAADLLGRDRPPLKPWDVAQLSPMAQRFYAESKRVSNARAKAELGWRPLYPSYREGLAAILTEGA